MMQKLRKQAAHSKTPVIFHGWLDNRDERYKILFETASIFCLMSTNENASTSLLEGLSAGCAVVTTNTSGCPETVGDAGICLDPGEIDKLSNVLKSLIRNDPYRISLMQAARTRALHIYQWPTITGRYIDLLQSIRRK